MKIRAMTLVELLMVISIVAVLAASTIMPMFRETRRDAQEAKVKKELEAIRLGCIQYHYDTGQWPPLGILGQDLVTNDLSRDNWHGPYVDIWNNDPWHYPYSISDLGIAILAESYGPNGVSEVPGDDLELLITPDSSL